MHVLQKLASVLYFVTFMLVLGKFCMLSILSILFTDLLLCRKGNDRRVAVFKPVQHQGNRKYTATPLSFSAASQEVLADLFSRHPPVEEELVLKKWDTPAIISTSSSTSRRRDGSNRGKSSKQWTMSPDEIARQAAALASRLQKVAALQKVGNFVTSFPVGCGLRFKTLMCLISSF